MDLEQRLPQEPAPYRFAQSVPPFLFGAMWGVAMDTLMPHPTYDARLDMTLLEAGALTGGMAFGKTMNTGYVGKKILRDCPPYYVGAVVGQALVAVAKGIL